mmetsp:Transcript_29296/g.64594  ORF Transcript_29296/g.64594 Transcript_29296/m.64594 type:complete len:559 (+) Transcript_29296:454-2130(+)
MASTSCSSLVDGDISRGITPEMDKLLPSLPKEPVAECTESTGTPRGRSGIDNPDRKNLEQQQEPFCSPAPPPFPFSLSYSSKSESSGERGSAGGEKKRRNSNDGIRDTSTYRSDMVAVTSTPTDVSSASNSAPSSSASAANKEKAEKKRSETLRSPVAKHPGERLQETCVQNDGKVKNPIEDPMYTSLFTNEDDSKRSAAGRNSNSQAYASPDAIQVQAGKVVTEGEDESPVEGAKIDPQLTRYENNYNETSSRGTHVASHYFPSTSPDQAYYPYPLSHQHFYETGHGAEDIPQGYPSYPYPESRPNDDITYGSYSYYADHASPYNYSPYPGSGYVGNHAEHAYHAYHHGGEHSPGQVSYSSSHSPGTYHQSPNHQASHDSNGNVQASPYEAMPQIEPSSPPYKKQRSTSSAWSDRFCQLVEYSRAHGDCNVPQKYPENASLGIWVNKQRMEYKLFQEGKKSSMTLERIQKLESIGFVWAKRKGPEAWETKFRELVLYKEEHGDCLVPTKYTRNKALGRWVSTQRAQFKLWDEGKKSTLTDGRKERLENIGFVWRLQF